MAGHLTRPPSRRASARRKDSLRPIRQRRHLAKLFEEIVPVGIIVLNERELPLTRPPFDRSFALNGSFDTSVGFVPDKHMHAILPCKFRCYAFLVRANAIIEFIRHARVQSAIASARQDVSPTAILPHVLPPPKSLS